MSKQIESDASRRAIDQTSDVTQTLERVAGCVMLHDLLHVHALERPDRIAVEDGTTTITYAELSDRSERLAARLRAVGLEPGDRIALLSKNDGAVG